MKKLILLLMASMMLTAGCMREVYIDKNREVIREKDKSSDVRIIDRDKQVYERDRKVIKESPRPGSSTSEPTESDYQSVLD